MVQHWRHSSAIFCQALLSCSSCGPPCLAWPIFALSTSTPGSLVAVHICSWGGVILFLESFTSSKPKLGILGFPFLGCGVPCCTNQILLALSGARMHLLITSYWILIAENRKSSSHSTGIISFQVVWHATWPYCKGLPTHITGGNEAASPDVNLEQHATLKENNSHLVIRCGPLFLDLFIAASSASISSSPWKPDFCLCLRSLLTADMLLFFACAFSFSLSACTSLLFLLASRCFRLHKAGISKGKFGLNACVLHELFSKSAHCTGVWRYAEKPGK